VRWEHLSTEAEELRRLPGYRDEAVVRTFDAPEAMDTRFYEVRAKSALNRVPEASRMPFRWTINPYRGCTHACTYCMSGNTPILMGDGRTRPISDLMVGDAIYGTVRRGAYRRYALTKVLAHWETPKEAFSVMLEDGTELIASGDHRFLSRRGWKHVTGTEWGRDQRPHLTPNDRLQGVGAFAEPPGDSPDYRHIGTYSYDRPGRDGTVHRFRLALTDLEALRRARNYLDDLAISTQEFPFPVAMAGARPMTAIRTSAKASVDAVKEIVRWPRHPTDAWCKGFLAGIFDAEGSCSRGILRIPNTDPEIIEWTTFCLRRFGFSFTVEDLHRDNGLRCVRLLGGLPERLRFFQTADTAITRKRSIEGTAVKTVAQLRVVGVEALGEQIPMYDITTGTGDFIANGVISHNCFARPTHTYLDFNARRDFEREIVVKVNAPEVLRVELARKSWKHEHVALGTNTDPYQWVEKRYRLMPGIWEALLESGTPCSVLTKSPLLLRDIEIMKRLAERVGFTANLSVPTLDEKAWRATEPHTPHPRARLEAVAKLNRAGIPTGILVAPLMPGINDAPEQVEPILELAREAGATHIGGVALHLRREVKQIFFDWLRSQRPDLIPRYEKLYRRGAYMPTEERRRIQALVKPGRGPEDQGGRLTPRGVKQPEEPETPPAESPKAPRQEALF
jgi:DNA repair photolyase